MIRNERGFAVIFKEYPLRLLLCPSSVLIGEAAGLKAVIDACDGPRLGQWRMKLPPRKPSQGLAGAGGAQGGQGVGDWAVSTSSLLLGLPPSTSLMVVLPELQL